MLYLLLGFLIGLAIVHLSAFYFYLFCKQRNRGVNKECRNVECRYGRECKYNSLYNDYKSVSQSVPDLPESAEVN